MILHWSLESSARSPPLLVISQPLRQSSGSNVPVGKLDTLLKLIRERINSKTVAVYLQLLSEKQRKNVAP